MTEPSAARLLVAALALLLAAAVPVPAEVAGSDFQIDNGFVRSWADPFTDAYTGTILLLSGEDDAAARIYHYGGVEFSIQFFGEVSDDHEDDAPVDVVWRIDGHDAYKWQAYWADGHTATRVANIDAVDAIADRIIHARRLIYRIGEDGDVVRVRIPYEMPELVAEFRRRVAASSQTPP